MSKSLYLMRHGQAQEVSGLSDIDRALTDKGMRDARRQGLHIFKGNVPDRFLVSTAARTVQTAMHVKEELQFSDQIIQFEASMYNASIRELLSITNNLDDLWQTVCLVGHNPSITYLAEFLTGHSIGNVNTAGVVKMTFDGSWAELKQGDAYFEFYRPRE